MKKRIGFTAFGIYAMGLIFFALLLMFTSFTKAVNILFQWHILCLIVSGTFAVIAYVCVITTPKKHLEQTKKDDPELKILHYSNNIKELFINSLTAPLLLLLGSWLLKNSREKIVWEAILGFFIIICGLVVARPGPRNKKKEE